LTTRNVNTALEEMVRRFSLPHNLRTEESRKGRCLVIDEPMLITYTHPRERVLLNNARDANPFFHLYEALWMLAGRNDVAPLTYYNSRMPEFSDDGKTLNGAYGHRWRHAEAWNPETNYPDRTEVNQLDLLVSHLKAVPNSRRAILQMWNVEDDLLKIGGTCPRCGGPGCYACDKGGGDYPGEGHYQESKDVCCNLDVMFQLRQVGFQDYPESKKLYKLDMTVTNRSNDLLWGMLGANYVHFSFLQEYMAARLGAEVGRYHHFTNNLHVYVDRPDWKPDALLKDVVTDYPRFRHGTPPLVLNHKTFDEEVVMFVGGHSACCLADRTKYEEPFFKLVAQPFLNAYHWYKEGSIKAALVQIESVEADDWRLAGKAWLEKRAIKGGTHVG
jgi:thymidylate synthase